VVEKNNIELKSKYPHWATLESRSALQSQRATSVVEESDIERHRSSFAELALGNGLKEALRGGIVDMSKWFERGVERWHR